MKVAVIGAGHIGGNVARPLALAGHEVTVSFSRDLMKARRPAGAVSGEGYRLEDAIEVVGAVKQGRPIPPTPAYEEA